MMLDNDKNTDHEGGGGGGSGVDAPRIDGLPRTSSSSSFAGDGGPFGVVDSHRMNDTDAASAETAPAPAAPVSLGVPLSGDSNPTRIDGAGEGYGRLLLSSGTGHSDAAIRNAAATTPVSRAPPSATPVGASESASSILPSSRATPANGSGTRTRTRSRSRSRTLECILGEEAAMGGGLTTLGPVVGTGSGSGSRVRHNVGGGRVGDAIPEGDREEEEEDEEDATGIGRATGRERASTATAAAAAAAAITASPPTNSNQPPQPSSTSSSRVRSATIAAVGGAGDDSKGTGRRSRAASNAAFGSGAGTAGGSGGPTPIGGASVSIAFSNPRRPRRGSNSAGNNGGEKVKSKSIARRLSLSSSHRSRRSTEAAPPQLVDGGSQRASQEGRPATTSHTQQHAHFADEEDRIGGESADNDGDADAVETEAGGNASRSAANAVSHFLGNLGRSGSSNNNNSNNNNNRRRRSSTVVSAASSSSKRRGARHGESQGDEDDEDEEEDAEEQLHRSEVVEHLDCIDPAVGTVGNLQNIGNTIMFPQIPGFSRKPVVTLPTVESSAEQASESKRMSKSRRGTITRHDSSTSLNSLTGSATSEKLGRQPSSSADDHDDSSDDALDAHVKDVLSKRQRIKRILVGTWAFIKTPMGAVVAIYGFLVAFWGAAIVLFLLGWIKTGSDYNKKLWIEISSQIENGLFTITGIGLIPWRVRDAYRMCVIWHYKLVSRRLRKRQGLPPIEFKHDLPDPLLDPTFVPVLTEKQQARLRRNQEAFAASQTWYRAHATETHLAFDINYALTITLLIVLNSVFQCMLCGTMWGLNRFNRPAWTTGCLIPLSFLCMIISSILIWQGGEHTKKRKEVEEKLREALDLPDEEDEKALISKDKKEKRPRWRRGSKSSKPTMTKSKTTTGTTALGDESTLSLRRDVATLGGSSTKSLPNERGVGHGTQASGDLRHSSSSSQDFNLVAVASEENDIQMKALARVKHEEQMAV